MKCFLIPIQVYDISFQKEIIKVKDEKWKKYL